jgi:hypothetical protein
VDSHCWKVWRGVARGNYPKAATPRALLSTIGSVPGGIEERWHGLHPW